MEYGLNTDHIIYSDCRLRLSAEFYNSYKNNMEQIQSKLMSGQSKFGSFMRKNKVVTFPSQMKFNGLTCSIPSDNQFAFFFLCVCDNGEVLSGIYDIPFNNTIITNNLFLSYKTKKDRIKITTSFCETICKKFSRTLISHF